jgi:hypothetical protein
MKSKYHRYNRFVGVFKDELQASLINRKHFGKSSEACWAQFWVKGICFYVRLPIKGGLL